MAFEVEFKNIRHILKQIEIYKYRNGQPLSMEHKILSNEISQISLAMFSKLKLDNKQFTVCRKSSLRKIRIGEDDDGLNTDDLCAVENFLSNNSEAFYELTGKTFIKKTTKDYKTDNQIFYLSIFSKYTAREEDVLVYNNCGLFMVYSDIQIKIPLQIFIQDYFGIINDETIYNTLGSLALDKTLEHEAMQDKLNELTYEINQLLKMDYQMQEGTITFFDFLGWKGLWLSKDDSVLENVSQLIGTFNKKLKELTKELFPASNGIMMSKLISISDTIAVFTPRLSTVTEIKLIEMHVDLSRFILEQSVEQGFPIRGAITYGEYSFKDNIMIGPGIDECASWHEKADWIGSILTPSAQFKLQPCYNKDKIVKYRIPFKGNTPAINCCVKWKLEDGVFDKLLKNTKAMLPEIASKYLNTNDFLDLIWKEKDLDE